MTVEHAILRHLLAGSEVAAVKMRWGSPGPIRLPSGDELDALIAAHLSGSAATVWYSPKHGERELRRVEPCKMLAYSPRADGRCSWAAIDLDAEDHGGGGLANTLHAARCIAERADNAGLGVLTVRSGGGRGVHVWALFAEPVELDAAVIGVARLATDAIRVATLDVADAEGEHAFRTGRGSVATPGDRGAVELFPKSRQRTPVGWAIALPFRGGARALDVFENREIELDAVPIVDAEHWRRYVAEAHEHIRRTAPAPAPTYRPKSSRDPLANLDARTADFLAGRVAEGGRNTAAFASSCSLLARGIPEHEVERLILDGGRACGLPERETRTALASAIGTLRARGRR